ncbi:MAG: alpha/beta hydrolase [Anaerolineales bacterium]|nr:MAG: alpha/beta hydrolase [Anaerolineales bacterium]
MQREPVRFESDGLTLAGHLYLPAGQPPCPVVIICHGLISCKENHAEFACFLQERGLAALAFDFRGHGESQGCLDARVLHDISAAIAYLCGRPEVDAERLAIRGSSMGGHYALHAGAAYPALKAVVAICPSSEANLKRGIFNVEFWQSLSGVEGAKLRLALPDYLSYLRQHNIFAAVSKISPRALFLTHCQDDEIIPYQNSQRLYELAGQPKKLLLLEGGDHRTAQHDPSVHEATVDWLREQLR